MIYCFSEFFPENSIFEGQENEEGRHWGQVIRIPMGRDVRKTKDVGGVSHAISQSHGMLWVVGKTRCFIF